MNRREALAALVAMPNVARISAVPANSDDVIVVECDGMLSREDMRPHPGQDGSDLAEPEDRRARWWASAQSGTGVMLLFYIGRLRVLWSSFFTFRASRHGWLQIGRLVVDVYGGKGIVFRSHRIW